MTTERKKNIREKNMRKKNRDKKYINNNTPDSNEKILIKT